MIKDCEKCVFKIPCVLCTFVNKKKVFGKPKPLKYSPNVEEIGLGNIWMNNYDRTRTGN